VNDFTEDAILRGLVRVVQPRRGYRFSVDALLLADFALRGRTTRALDLGCGSGVIAMILARRLPAAHVVGVEIQPELCEAARRGVALNDLEARVGIIEGDLCRIETLVPEGAFDLVVCNPPFFSPERGRKSSDGGRALARHALGCNIGDVLRAARHACSHDGRLSLIYPERDLPAVPGLWLGVVRPVAARGGQPPHRFLMELHRSASTDVEEMPPLVVHQEEGYTPEMQRILGDA